MVAHYQVEEGGRIGPLVWDSNTAWSLGNFDANQRSINIEHANRESRKERFEVQQRVLLVS